MNHERNHPPILPYIAIDIHSLASISPSPLLTPILTKGKTKTPTVRSPRASDSFHPSILIPADTSIKSASPNS